MKKEIQKFFKNNDNFEEFNFYLQEFGELSEIEKSLEFYKIISESGILKEIELPVVIHYIKERLEYNKYREVLELDHLHTNEGEPEWTKEDLPPEYSMELIRKFYSGGRDAQEVLDKYPDFDQFLFNFFGEMELDIVLELEDREKIEKLLEISELEILVTNESCYFLQLLNHICKNLSISENFDRTLIGIIPRYSEKNCVVETIKENFKRTDLEFVLEVVSEFLKIYNKR